MLKLSREEKRKRVLELFHEGQEFYQLKDLEKMSKEKGINQNHVKEILQMLVDDALVDSEKIGSSSFFWSFPNKIVIDKTKQLDEMRDTKRELNNKLVTLEAVLKSEQETQNDSDKLERDSLVNSISSLRSQEEDLLDYVKKNEVMDPQKVEKLKNDAKALTEAANRWTDNVFNIKSWCTKKFNIQESEIDKQFRIPNNFDYLDL